MDNLTHTLTGLALSRAGLDRFYSRSALVLMIAANIPDVDIVAGLAGAVSYLHYHRGLTHSIAFMPVMALVPVLIAWAVSRSRAGLLGAYLLSMLGVASHLLIDWTNSYAIRLLLPFSGQWLHGDLNNVVDLWIWAVLLLMVVGPLLGKLVSSEIGAKPTRGRGLALFALSFFLLYDFGRYLLHQRALEVLNSRIYDGATPRRVAAFPGAVNPLRWAGWVETDLEVSHFDLNLASEFDPNAGTKFYRPDPNPAMQEALKTEPFRVLSDFAIYPLWRVSPSDIPEGGTRVELTDERFPFTATAVLDRANRVIRSSLHF